MQITVKVQGLSKALKSLDQFQYRTILALKRAVKMASEAGARKLKQAHMSGRGPTSVARISGALKKSVIVEPVVVSAHNIKGGLSFGKGVPHAITHIRSPRGKKLTIKAKNRTFLAIPSKFARTPAGKPRGGPTDPIWGDTFQMQHIIWGFRRGTARQYAKPVPLFYLKREVKVPSRIDPEVDVVNYLRPWLTARVGEAIKGAVVRVA